MNLCPAVLLPTSRSESDLRGCYILKTKVNKNIVESAGLLGSRGSNRSDRNLIADRPRRAKSNPTSVLILQFLLCSF